MVDETSLLRFFYKQNKVVTLDNLFEKFGVDDSVLKPIETLTQNDWLNEVSADSWIINEDGRQEYERRIKISNPIPHTIITGNTGNVIAHSSFDKSFNPQASNNPPIKKSKITIGDIVKVISGIVVITLAALKGCGVI